MPALKKAKHEAVLQAFIADPERDGPAAYRKVYSKTSRHAAETGWSRLLKNVEFSARRAELEEKAADAAVERGVMSKEEVLLAISKHGRDGNMKALDLMGQHYRLFTQKLEIDDKSRIGERLDAALRRFTQARSHRTGNAGAAGAGRKSR
jgi:hypothetical protein